MISYSSDQQLKYIKIYRYTQVLVITVKKKEGVTVWVTLKTSHPCVYRGTSLEVMRFPLHGFTRLSSTSYRSTWKVTT